MRKLLLSSLIAIAFGSAGSAQAASAIKFDINGAAAGGVITVDTFDWAPDNGLIIGGATPGNTLVEVLAQGSLGTFIKSGVPNTFTSPIAGTEFTYQIDMFELSTPIGAATVALTPLFGVIHMYYDPTADANQLAGTGYGGGGDAVEILTGSIVFGAGSVGTFTDLTLAAPGFFPLSPLDQFTGSGNNYPTVLSDQGSGNTGLDIDVTYADPNFFKSQITSLVIDLQDSTNNTTPFKQADPAAEVMGFVPRFTDIGGGQLVNGQPAFCTGECDFLIQTDASSTFNPTTTVPEPGSLALLSLGLLGAGFASRRKNR